MCARVLSLAFAVLAGAGCREHNPAFRPVVDDPPDAAFDHAGDRAAPPPDGWSRGDSPGSDAGVGSPIDAPPLQVLDGLIGWWRLDESSGNVATDSSGSGNHARLLLGTPQWGTGRVGGALKLARTAFRVPPSASLDSVGAHITIAAWVRPTEAGVGWQIVLSRQKGPGTFEHYGLGRSSNLAAAVIGELPVFATGPMPLQTWSHIAVTSDGAAAVVYVNGVERGRGSQAGAATPDVTPLIIGGNINDDFGTVTELFMGDIDDLRLYRRTLTPAEIARLAAP